ncbi:MAG: 2-hydroxyacid dehydrogenase [Bdellovibrionota bacterium]
MKALVFSSHSFERPIFAELGSNFPHQLIFTDLTLSGETVSLASGFPAICAFANDCLNAEVLGKLKAGGTRYIALRSAGFNNVDLAEASRLLLKVARVPAYSPHAVAEHAVAMILCLDRNLIRASARVHDLNFSLDGLVGFDLYGKTVGVAGAGKIGCAFARIMKGFGCRVLVHDLNATADLPGAAFVTKEQMLKESDIVSLHIPLTPGSRHYINEEAVKQMKDGAMLINTGRGGLVDTKTLISALKSGKIRSAGLDVYEEEENIFSHDFSGAVLQDDLLARLMTFPNVLITAHQAFLTHEAIRGIVSTTLQNLSEFDSGAKLTNEVKIP